MSYQHTCLGVRLFIVAGLWLLSRPLVKAQAPTDLPTAFSAPPLSMAPVFPAEEPIFMDAHAVSVPESIYSDDLSSGLEGLCTEWEVRDIPRLTAWSHRFGWLHRLRELGLRRNEFGRMDVGGWLAWGLYDNSHGLDGANGNRPLYFNNIAEEPVLHQAWVYLDRPADNRGEGLAFGFRSDALFGADAPQIQAFGDGSWDAGWDTSGEYGFAVPQLFGEMAVGRTKFKLGRFFSIFGYEQVQAPSHFFFSHTFSNSYNKPFTQSGLMVERAWTPKLTSIVMRTGGWDSGFANDNDGKLSLGGLRWIPGNRFSIFGGISIGDPGDSATSESDLYFHNVIWQLGLTERLRYISDHTFQTRRSEIPAGGESAFKQYGLAHYLVLQCTDRIGVGMRYEGLYAGAGVGPPLGSIAANPGSHLHNLSFACNIRLRRVLLKPEFRYDWVDFDGATPGGPFDDGQRRSQATWGIQSVLQW